MCRVCAVGTSLLLYDFLPLHCIEWHCWAVGMWATRKVQAKHGAFRVYFSRRLENLRLLPVSCVFSILGRSLPGLCSSGDFFFITFTSGYTIGNMPLVSERRRAFCFRCFYLLLIVVIDRSNGINQFIFPSHFRYTFIVLLILQKVTKI